MGPQDLPKSIGPSSGGIHAARLTISGGVAVAGAGSESWDGVVAIADAALYSAKEGGRDRVLGPDGLAAEAA
jgi:GGDEF domain-containing protein